MIYYIDMLLIVLAVPAAMVRTIFVFVAGVAAFEENQNKNNNDDDDDDDDDDELVLYDAAPPRLRAICTTLVYLVTAFYQRFVSFVQWASPKVVSFLLFIFKAFFLISWLVVKPFFTAVMEVTCIQRFIANVGLFLTKVGAVLERFGAFLARGDVNLDDNNPLDETGEPAPLDDDMNTTSPSSAEASVDATAPSDETESSDTSPEENWDRSYITMKTYHPRVIRRKYGIPEHRYP